MKPSYKLLLFSSLGAFFLLIITFYNGFPLVYSDSSTYIESGFALVTPVDRPITYGIFIRLTSLNGFSLWLVAFFQSMLLSYLLLLTIKDFTKSLNPYRLFLIVMLFLSMLTVLPFVSGQIIADVFQSISFLCILHLGLNKKLKKCSLILIFIIFFISNAMHMSHIAINGLFIIGILLIQKLFFKTFIVLKKRNIGIAFLLIILGIVTMGSAVSKSRNIFFMGRLAENGILLTYLKDNCEVKKFVLCDCIDSIPSNTTDFLWGENSPLNTKYTSWSDAKEEFGTIINETVTTPKYLWMHIKYSAKSTVKQLYTFKAGDGNGAFVGDELLFKRIGKYFSKDVKSYLHSKQSQGQLKSGNLKVFNFIYSWGVYLSLVSISCLFLVKGCRKRISNDLKFITFILLFGIFINSMMNASLVITTDRFGAKVIWFIPFIAILLAFEVVASYRKTIQLDSN